MPSQPELKSLIRILNNASGDIKYIFAILKEFNKRRDDNEFLPCMRCIAVAFDKHFKVINVGINKRKTHPFCQKYHNNMRLTIHAEIDLLIKLLKNGKNKTKYIAIVRGYNNLDSIPCPLCLEYLMKYLDNDTILFVEYNKKIVSTTIKQLVANAKIYHKTQKVPAEIFP